MKVCKFLLEYISQESDLFPVLGDLSCALVIKEFFALGNCKQALAYLLRQVNRQIFLCVVGRQQILHSSGIFFFCFVVAAVILFSANWISFQHICTQSRIWNFNNKRLLERENIQKISVMDQLRIMNEK